MKIFKCEVCGNVIEKIIDKGVPVMCCGKPMVELTANTTDGAMEKHVPVAEIKEGKLEVTVGSVEHPMRRNILLQISGQLRAHRSCLHS